MECIESRPEIERNKAHFDVEKRGKSKQKQTTNQCSEVRVGKESCEAIATREINGSITKADLFFQ